jgi:hypothetical protein
MQTATEARCEPTMDDVCRNCDQVKPEHDNMELRTHKAPKVCELNRW